MTRLVCSIISICLFLGATDALVTVTLKMAGFAAYAHQHDQISYAKFTRAMIGGKPRPRTSPTPKPNEAR
jgi:hypothetical protein